MVKGRHFDRSVILLCVQWYLAYNPSLRNLEEMMESAASRSIMQPFTGGLSATHPRCSTGSIGANEASAGDGRWMRPASKCEAMEIYLSSHRQPWGRGPVPV